jgi:hypothetical protein
MKIETKFDIGDEIWFMYSPRDLHIDVRCEVIRGILINSINEVCYLYSNEINRNICEQSAFLTREEAIEDAKKWIEKTNKEKPSYLQGTRNYILEGK